MAGLCVFDTWWLEPVKTVPAKIVIIIIMAGMAVFYVAGYLIEERRRWPVITARTMSMF